MSWIEVDRYGTWSTEITLPGNKTSWLFEADVRSSRSADAPKYGEGYWGTPTYDAAANATTVTMSVDLAEVDRSVKIVWCDARVSSQTTPFQSLSPFSACFRLLESTTADIADDGGDDEVESVDFAEIYLDARA